MQTSIHPKSLTKYHISHAFPNPNIAHMSIHGMIYPIHHNKVTIHQIMASLNIMVVLSPLEIS